MEVFPPMNTPSLESMAEVMTTIKQCSDVAHRCSQAIKSHSPDRVAPLNVASSSNSQLDGKEEICCVSSIGIPSTAHSIKSSKGFAQRH
ncbi:hypothetical protein SynBIOSE41_01761 [Synechococcus sp. BIOS-E4-1]|nr:hypothetical protein SynBIOSE41_01761 [Synechococcus sp. BIOS-E4-1]